ncbi:MAG: hypothetical protein WC862_03600 [Patescibacteria group bacterium]
MPTTGSPEIAQNLRCFTCSGRCMICSISRAIVVRKHTIKQDRAIIISAAINVHVIVSLSFEFGLERD